MKMLCKTWSGVLLEVLSWMLAGALTVKDCSSVDLKNEYLVMQHVVVCASEM